MEVIDFSALGGARRFSDMGQYNMGSCLVRGQHQSDGAVKAVNMLLQQSLA
jgi:hypothetical protein